MVYLLTFAATIALAYLVSRLDYKTQKWKVIGISVLAVLLPSILAGCRATSVGIDVEAYVVPNFRHAVQGASLKEMFNFYMTKEPFFTLLTFFTAQVTDSIQVLLFAMQLITFGCVYVGAYRLRREISFPLVIAIYLLMYHNDSYNLMRQHMAMAVLLMGAAELFRKKYIRYLVYIVIAALFHTTAVIALSLVVVHWAMYRWKEGKHGKKVKWIVIIGAALALLSFPLMKKFFISTGLLGERFTYYFKRPSVSGNTMETLVYLLEVAAIFLFASKLKDEIKSFDFMQANACLSLIVLQFGRVLYYGNRLGMYFNIINVLMLAQLPCVGRNKREKLLFTGGVIAVIAFYWYYLFIRGGVGITYPYVPFWG